MITLILLGALTLGMLSWALGGAAIFRRGQGLSTLSLGSCAISILLACVYFGREIRAQHWDNLTDTADAMLFSAVILMGVPRFWPPAPGPRARPRGRHAKKEPAPGPKGPAGCLLHLW